MLPEDETPLISSSHKQSGRKLRYFVLGACIGVSIALVFLVTEGNGVHRIQSEAGAMVNLMATRSAARDVKHIRETVQGGPFALPPLPWDVTSLEPYISRDTVVNHYQLHQGYVVKLNRQIKDTDLVQDSLEEVIEKAYAKRILESISDALEMTFSTDSPFGVAKISEAIKTKKHNKKSHKIKLEGEFHPEVLGQLVSPTQTGGKWSDLFNVAAQNWNHQFYWKSLSSATSDKLPNHFEETPLGYQLIRDFGSVHDFATQFKEMANKSFGSTWCWLVFDPLAKEPNPKLRIISTHDADTPKVHNLIPLLTIDLWEHAYYLDYQTKRVEYVQSVLNHLVNWTFVEDNYKKALHLPKEELEEESTTIFRGTAADLSSLHDFSERRETQSTTKNQDQQIQLEERYLEALYGA